MYSWCAHRCEQAERVCVHCVSGFVGACAHVSSVCVQCVHRCVHCMRGGLCVCTRVSRVCACVPVVCRGVCTHLSSVCAHCVHGVCAGVGRVCTGCVDVGVCGGCTCVSRQHTVAVSAWGCTPCVHTRVCTLAMDVCVHRCEQRVFALCEYSVRVCVRTHVCALSLCTLYIGVRAHTCAGVVCTMCEPCAIMAIRVCTHTRVQVCVCEKVHTAVPCVLPDQHSPCPACPCPAPRPPEPPPGRSVAQRGWAPACVHRYSRTQGRPHTGTDAYAGTTTHMGTAARRYTRIHRDSRTP